MAKAFANHLDAAGFMLDLFEQSPERKTAIQIEPDYQTMKSHESDLFEKGVRAMAAAGHVDIRMRRRPDDHLIDRVVLKRPEGLYGWLGRRPRRDLAIEAWTNCIEDDTDLPPWFEHEKVHAIAAWSRHSSWRGLHLEQAGDASLAVKLAVALEEGVDPGTSYRIFSARHANDSKALKRLEFVVSGILRDARGMPAVRPGEEPLAFLGISTYPEPILLRGPFLAGRNRGVDLREFELYAAVSPMSAGTLQWDGTASYVLTIENKTSFNAYVRKFNDTGVVIYTGGFPSGPTASALRVVAAGSQDVPWYHWGDIDGGGLAIFRYLEAEICRPAGIRLHPHLMNVDLAKSLGQMARRDLRVLKEIALSDSSVCSLAQYLLGGGNVLEQEVVSPVMPLSADISVASLLNPDA